MATFQQKGWWGDVTSNVDWCEPNYTMSHYIAEFYNSVSSLPMILIGLYGVMWVLKAKADFYGRFLFGYVFLAIVGFGSVMFHMTLKYEYQLLDELPMILGTLPFLYIIMDIRIPERVNAGDSVPKKEYTPASSRVLATRAVLITLYGLLTVFSMYSFNHSPLPMFISYAMVCIFFGVRAILIFWNSTDPILNFWFHVTIWSYILGGLVWVVEKNFCDPLRPVSEYLHMVWHLFAGYATYVAVTWTYFLKSKECELNPTVKLLFGFLPSIQNKAKKLL